MLTWQFFDEWFLRLLNANHFVGGCSLFIYSIAIELYIFKIKKAHFCGQWCQPKNYDGWHLFLYYMLKIILYSKVLCI